MKVVVLAASEGSNYVTSIELASTMESDQNRYESTVIT